MSVKARPRGLLHFQSVVRDFSKTVAHGKARTEHLHAPTAELTQGAAFAREALEELRTHQEELTVADEELRAQLDELALSSARVHVERDRYRELFDLAPDPYFLTDRSGAIRDVNAAGAAMLGIESRFLQAKPLAALVDSADARVLREAISALRTSSSTEVELRFRPRVGAPRWHLIKGVGVEENSAVLWIARDVQSYHDRTAALANANDHLGADVRARTNDLERANRDKDELLERERRLRTQLESEHVAKDRFLSVLSHDLRAPLNAVLGWTQLLRREKLDTNARDRALATIERNARAQLRLVEELLDISRFAADKVQLERVPVELRDLVQPLVDGALAEARDRRIELDVSLGSEPLVVAGDRRRLEQVVTNLLSNSLKFTPPGGRVTVTLDHDESHVRMQVTDTGRGIAPDVLPHVFDAFRQQATDYTSTYEGLGLGLYIVRQAVEMHGGEVVGESGGPDAGSRFTVRLPLTAIGMTHVPAARESRLSLLPQAATLDGLRILVVDDEDDARELMATILRHRGAIVTVAADVTTALRCFESFQPDVLVSDVAMPGRSGLDLARELRSRPRTSAMLVAVSGFVSPDEAERALDAGFDLHVSKPVEPHELVEAVRDAVRLRAR